MRGGALAVRRANPRIQSGDATLVGGERYLVRRTQLRVDMRLLPSVVLQTGRHKDIHKLHSALLPDKVLPATGPYVMSNDEQEYDIIALLQVIKKGPQCVSHLGVTCFTPGGAHTPIPRINTQFLDIVGISRTDDRLVDYTLSDPQLGRIIPQPAVPFHLHKNLLIAWLAQWWLTVGQFLLSATGAREVTEEWLSFARQCGGCVNREAPTAKGSSGHELGATVRSAQAAGELGDIEGPDGEEDAETLGDILAQEAEREQEVLGDRAARPGDEPGSYPTEAEMQETLEARGRMHQALGALSAVRGSFFLSLTPF